MNRDQKLALKATTVIGIGIAAGMFIFRHVPAPPLLHISVNGAVLKQDTDPRKQMPIGDVEITGASGAATGECKSDSSGFFHLTLTGGTKPGQAIALTFRRPGYQPLDVTEPLSEQIYIARMTPLPSEVSVKPNSPEVPITDVQLRYAMKSTTTLNVGSFFKIFEVVNTGGVPCRNHPPCSPDGKWKAAIGSPSYDADEGNQFSDVRVSCIAGPCPFTRIESDNFSSGGRTIKISVRNWSDTTTFLVEGEVIRTVVSDLIRHSYPVIFGDGLNFTLPATAEGLTIEASVNGADIVFPLGPDLNLSWAACTVKVDADQSKLYRCTLKPGYQFR